jgi:polyisoprenoid-binding protein YceI
MMITNVRGQFNAVSGTINYDPKNQEKSTVEASIEVASLTTGNVKRDQHLLSPDFFDAAKYPVITFRSTKVSAAGPGKGTIAGELTMHGRTRPVSMSVEHFGPVKAPDAIGGETVTGFAARLSINREDFGILWNVPLDAGGLMVSKEVDILLDIEADLES